MLEFHKKRKQRRILYSKGVLVLLLIIAVFLGKANLNVYKKNKESREKRVRAEQEYKELAAREEKLQQANILLTTEEGIEQEIRKKFNVVKEGEETLVIVEVPKESSEERKESVFRRFWNTIKFWE